MGSAERTTRAAVECSFCGKITGYKAVPGSDEEHRGYLDCIAALQSRLDAALSGLATGASKERESRGLGKF
jgi:hypothetical protein